MKRNVRGVAVRLAAVLLTGSALVLGLTAATASKPAAKSGDAEHAALVARGQYLSTVMGCNDCHTPGTLYGAPDFKRQLSGSELGWKGPWGISFAKNLTPDPETGLGYWSEAEIERALRTGIKNDGKAMLPPMPWPNFAGLTKADMHALIAYLQSVPPVKHQVPDAVPPGKDYAGAVLAFPPPPAWDAPAAPPAGEGK